MKYRHGSSNKVEKFEDLIACAEVRSQIYVALDAGYLEHKEFQQLNTLANEVARIVSGLRAAVQRQRDNQ